MIKFIKTEPDKAIILIRLLVGLVFFSEGIQKFLFPESVGTGRFLKIGFSDPAFWAYFTACFEIVGGMMITIGLLVKPASIPLMAIMITAFITTKIPVLSQYGFWQFAHEYRTDFAMTLSLIFLFIKGGGFYSLDYRIYRNKNTYDI